MFYHDDGIPDEEAFLKHLIKMKDGESVEIPKGMKMYDADMCIGSADRRTHAFLERRGKKVYATEDAHVKFVFHLEPGIAHALPATEPWEMFAWKQAVDIVKKKHNGKWYDLTGDVITVGGKMIDPIGEERND